jgi:hypothetical protein
MRTQSIRAKARPVIRRVNADQPFTERQPLDERAVLESLSNHIGIKLAQPESKDLPLNF